MALDIVKVRLTRLIAVIFIPSLSRFLSIPQLRLPESHCFACGGMPSHTRLRIFDDLDDFGWLKEGREEAPVLRG
jgi:hypothetical protein